MPRVEITPGRPVNQARPLAPIIIGGPTALPDAVPATVTAVFPPVAPAPPVEDPITAVEEHLDVVADRIDASEATVTDVPTEVERAPVEVMASATSTRTPPRRDTSFDVGDDQSRRLRIAVGPGRPSTTVGAEAKVWSQWTQEVKTPESSPIEATAEATPANDDDECPHCASARYRGARFCGKCGRNLVSAVTAS